MGDSRSPVDRRTFLGQSARVTGGAAIASTALSYARILGANDRISLGHIGVGRRGSELAADRRPAEVRPQRRDDRGLQTSGR